VRAKDNEFCKNCKNSFIPWGVLRCKLNFKTDLVRGTKYYQYCSESRKNPIHCNYELKAKLPKPSYNATIGCYLYFGHNWKIITDEENVYGRICKTCGEREEVHYVGGTWSGRQKNTYLVIFSVVTIILIIVGLQFT